MARIAVIRKLVVIGAAGLLLFGAASATAGRVRSLALRNPTTNCDAVGAAGRKTVIARIDACRASEGIGPIVLPSNWRSLTAVEQGFVLIDLERVNRGLRPISGLSASLNHLAAAGAEQHTDPSFPSGGYTGGGSIWAGTRSIVASVYLWMYDDGPNSSNFDCPSAGAQGCWGHRDIILWDRRAGRLVAGGAESRTGGGSFAYLILAGYPTSRLTFSWSRELAYFKAKPTVEIGVHAAKAHAKSGGQASASSSAPPGAGLSISIG